LQNFDRNFANLVAMSKTASKSMHNWRRNTSSNWYKIDQKTLFEIWRSLVVPSDATEKNHNIGHNNSPLLLLLETNMIMVE